MDDATGATGIERGTDRLARAHAVCQGAIDDAKGTVHEVVAFALAAGIDSLRAGDGNLDAADVADFLEGSHALEISDIADELAETDAEDLEGALLDAVGDLGDIEAPLVALIGPVEPLGGCDSNSFAVMTSGRTTTWAIRRGEHFLTFQSGDDGDSALDDGGPIADDPELRRARLAVAEELGGLGPGVWIEREAELSDELRDLTMFRGWHWPDCWQESMRYENLAELVEDELEPFAGATGLAETDARERLIALFEIGIPETDVERDLLWGIWTSIRPT